MSMKKTSEIKNTLSGINYRKNVTVIQLLS